MSLNIQTSTGLLEIGGSVTKEKVISALGYEPADKEVETTVDTHTKDTDIHITSDERTLWNKDVENLDAHKSDKTVHVTSSEKETWNNKSDFSGVYADLLEAPNITENDSGNMVVADEAGNIIMQVDVDGLATTNVSAKTIELDGEDLGVRLDELESMSLPNILDNESGDLTIADESGNVIMKVNADGLETTTVTAKSAVINGVDITAKLDEHKESIDIATSHVSNTDIHITTTERETWTTSIDQNTEDIRKLNTSLSSHTSNSTVHITADDRTLWDNKSDFSGDYNDLTNAPDIKEDNSGEVVYADEQGNVILRLGEAGLETTQVIADTIVAGGVNVETKLSGLDSTLSSHVGDTDIHITDEERTIWNEKSDFSGSYNDLTDVPTGLATESYVDTQVAALVNSAPETLDTLNELAAALGDDPNFAATVATQIGLKADKTALDTHTSNKVSHITADERATWNAKSDFSGDYNDLENAPNIAEDDSGSVVYADEKGNIIAKIDTNGFETTTVTAQSVVVNGVDVEIALNGKAESDHTHEQYLESSDIVDKADKAYVDEKIAEAKIDASNKDAVVLSEAQNGIAAVQATLSSHASDADIHIASAERTSWNAKADKTYVEEELSKMVAEVKADSSNKDAVILAETQKGLSTKVDKEDGKGLSSCDFTAAEKEKLATLDSLIESMISQKSQVQIITWEDDD